MVVTDFCPTCGTPRRADSPSGICPLCLLRLGLDAEDSPIGAGLDVAASSETNPAPAALNGVIERFGSDITTIGLNGVAARGRCVGSRRGRGVRTGPAGVHSR